MSKNRGNFKESKEVMRKKNKGITLVEMVVIVTIIAILLTIGILNYLNFVRREEIKNVSNFLKDAMLSLYDIQDKTQDYDTYFVVINNYEIPDSTGASKLEIKLIKYKNNSILELKSLSSKIVQLSSPLIVSGAGLETYLCYDKYGRLCRFSGSPGLRSNNSTYYTDQQIIVKIKNKPDGAWFEKKVILKSVPAGSVEVR